MFASVYGLQELPDLRGDGNTRVKEECSFPYLALTSSACVLCNFPGCLTSENLSATLSLTIALLPPSKGKDIRLMHTSMTTLIVYHFQAAHSRFICLGRFGVHKQIL
jgi:hypothetical protein